MLFCYIYLCIARFCFWRQQAGGRTGEIWDIRDISDGPTGWVKTSNFQNLMHTTVTLGARSWSYRSIFAKWPKIMDKSTPFNFSTIWTAGFEKKSFSSQEIHFAATKSGVSTTGCPRKKFQIEFFECAFPSQYSWGCLLGRVCSNTPSPCSSTPRR